MLNQLKLFDSHCHLDMPEFEGNIDAIVSKCEEVGIGGILMPGVTKDSWRRIKQISARKPICHAALGLHPMFVEKHHEKHLHDLEMSFSLGDVVAVGEIGLDFYESKNNSELQIKYFEAQIDIAKNANLPVILHVRKAHDHVLQILKKHNFSIGGIVHAFNGSEIQAEKYINMGFKLGFGGAMTFPRAAKLHKLAASLPLESIVLETDAPDMPPATCKTPFNTPLHLYDNFRSFVSLRNEPASVLAKQTTLNVQSVLRLNS
ncbi:MAG: TatD family hydrolase [Gammaproteobacteria bacterium]|nr:TatD family hydrolase [Gammaproteobacteria bacterium]